jgi:hypothetical protein
MRWDGDEGDDEGDDDGDDDGNDDDDDDNALFALQFDFALCSVSSHLNNRCIGWHIMLSTQTHYPYSDPQKPYRC